MRKTFDIVLDFDGTCVKHQFPEIGAPVPFAVEVLHKLVKNGHKLILFTMRSGKSLEEAVEWFRYGVIPLYGVQKNPTQHTWTSSPKAYGQIHIDDAALGCPLIYPEEGRPYVDWIKVEEILKQRGLL